MIIRVIGSHARLFSLFITHKEGGSGKTKTPAEAGVFARSLTFRF